MGFRVQKGKNYGKETENGIAYHSGGAGES